MEVLKENKQFSNIIRILPQMEEKVQPFSIFMKNILVAPFLFVDKTYGTSDKQQQFQNIYHKKWNGYRMFLTNFCFSIAILMDIVLSIWYFAANITNTTKATSSFYYFFYWCFSNIFRRLLATNYG